MTTLLSSTATFTMTLSGTFTRISDALNRYLDAKSKKARLAEHIKQLSAMDPHMLDDIGLKGFNRLPRTQQQNVLLDAMKNAKQA